MVAKATGESDVQQLLECFDAGWSPWVDLGQRIGVEALREVMEVFGGQKPHVPQFQEFTRKLTLEVRDRESRAKFHGDNYDELAGAYGIDPRHVRRIIHGRTDREKCPVSDDGQPARSQD